MALNAGTVQASAELNTRGFMRGLSDMKSKGRRAARQIGQTMRRAGSLMTGALTAPLAGAAGMALKTASDFEQLEIQLNTLAGSTEEGAVAFEKLEKFSATTPFQLDELARANNIILGATGSTEEALTAVEMLGDVSAATGARISDLAVTFSNAANEGKLMTRDIREFINRGIPLPRILAESMGVAEDAIFDLASQGKITFNVLEQALQDATSEGGLYANATEKAANSIQGAFSNLKDNVKLALADIGDAINNTFDISQTAREISGTIQRLTDWFNGLSEETRKMAFTVAGLIGAGGPILIALGALTSAFAAISWPVVLGVGAFGAASATIISNWEEVEQYFTSGGGAQMWDDFKGIISEFKTTAISLWETFGDDIMGITKSSFGIVLKTVETSLSGILEVMKKFNGNFDDELDIFEDHWLTTLRKIDSKIVGFTISAAKKLGQTFNLIDTEYDKIVREFEKRDLEFDFGLVFSDEDRKRALAFLGKVKTMEARASVGIDVPEDVIIPAELPSIKELMGNSDLAGDKIPVPPINVPVNIQKPEDKVIMPELPSADQLQAEFGQINLGEAILPPGSLGKLQERLQILRQEMKFATTTEGIDKIKGKIQLTKDQIAQLTGTVKKSGAVWQGFAQTVGNALQQAVIHGKELGSILSSVAKQLASKAIMTGLSFLLPGGAVAGETGFFNALFGGTFHDGGLVPGSGEKMIMAQGGEMVLTPDQQRALGGMIGSNNQPTMNYSSMKKAFQEAIRSETQRLGPNEIFAMNAKGSRGF